MAVLGGLTCKSGGMCAKCAARAIVRQPRFLSNESMLLSKLNVGSISKATRRYSGREQTKGVAFHAGCAKVLWLHASDHVSMPGMNGKHCSAPVPAALLQKLRAAALEELAGCTWWG